MLSGERFGKEQEEEEEEREDGGDVRQRTNDDRIMRYDWSGKALNAKKGINGEERW